MSARKKGPPPALGQIDSFKRKQQSSDIEADVRKGKSPRCLNARPSSLPTPGTLLSEALDDLSVKSFLSSRRPGDSAPLVEDNLFELMEEGFSPSASNAITPMKREAGVRACYVQVAAKTKGTVYNLMDQGSGAFLMSAKVENDVTYFSLYREFSNNCGVMRHEAATHSYTLYNMGCQECDPKHLNCGRNDTDRQKLAYFNHGQVLQGGLMSLFCTLPAVEADGTRTAWCPRLAKLKSERGKPPLSFPSCDDRPMQLASKKPKWNQKTQAYTLDFGGRVKLSSARNFQLVYNDRVVLQFGQSDEETFALDFRYPLCTLQAFAVAMSTLNWE